MSGVVRNKYILGTILVFSVFGKREVSAEGKRTFGESCSTRIVGFFSQEREERICDSDMGLICRGTCTCPPGRVFDFEDREGGRGCAGAVNSPCFGTSRNQQCVTGAHCQFAFCRCKPGFRPNGRHCIGTTNSNDQEEASPSPQQTRPATVSGITFPELQEIFAGFNGQSSTQQVNSFDKDNNDENRYNDRFHSSGIDDGDDQFKNDRFHIGPEINDFNDRFFVDSQSTNFNDRFQVSYEDRYPQENTNSRDGSRGSSGVRFEE